jgi:uncharacterized protein (DUF1800 family)
MQWVRGPLIALMCFSLVCPSEAGVTGKSASAGDSPTTKAHDAGHPTYPSAQIEGDQRIIHTLNRFTFGPRPGDLDAVRAMGLDRWFDQQLHPAQIDQAGLTARLAAYPAMKWSSEDLLRRLPSNAVIRQAIDGKVVIPENGVLHAVYEDQMYRVAEKKQEKQNKLQQPAAAPANGKGMAAPTTMDADAETAKSNGRSATLGKTGERPDENIAPDANGDHSVTDPAVVTTILGLPPQQRIARLVAMQPADAEGFFRSLWGPHRNAFVADMPPELKETVSALEDPQRTVVEELIAERLTRDIYSSAQVQEVMTDFWLNHFNVFLHKNEATPYYLVSYQRDAIRPHALGKFEDLLEEVAHSPAMLLYLDNASSTGPDSAAAERAKRNAVHNPNPKKNREGLNENYARELMELHTLGVNGGYTQADVIQVARVLTGWTVDRPQRGGGFRFEPNRHEPGTKKVMGKKFKENGEREGRDLLHFLVTRPATARFISRKLAVRFVSDNPPASLVERMAASYLSSGGDISAVLKTMFHSPEFWSTNIYRAKVKTPLEYVVSAVRASNTDITNLRPLANALREMGMPLYGAIPPTGYKWDATDWVSTGALVNRMNFALSLAANRLPGITTNWSQSPTGDSSLRTPQSEESRLESLLLASEVSDTTRTAVLQQFEAQSADAQTSPPPNRAQTVQVSNGVHSQNHAAAPSPQEKQDELLAGLLLGSPEFQRR